MAKLNIADALAYLNSVKAQVQDKPQVYNEFLDTMSQFRSAQIDTMGVIRRISELFDGYPSLIQSFNTFLPDGYHIDTTEDYQYLDPRFIIVTTPNGIFHATKNGPWKPLTWS